MAAVDAFVGDEGIRPNGNHFRLKTTIKRLLSRSSYPATQQR